MTSNDLNANYFSLIRNSEINSFPFLPKYIILMKAKNIFYYFVSQLKQEFVLLTINEHKRISNLYPFRLSSHYKNYLNE